MDNAPKTKMFGGHVVEVPPRPPSAGSFFEHFVAQTPERAPAPTARLLVPGDKPRTS